MREITPGVYRHFKGHLYYVLHTAIHTENGAVMVVYKALYGEQGYFVRPYDMFASEVDRDKYPTVQVDLYVEECTCRTLGSVAVQPVKPEYKP